MATKTLNTRISLKTDTTTNWATSTLVLLKGEAALEITESGDYKIKFGDGVKTFKELTYATMTPAEINTLITDGAVQSVSLATGTNNGTVKLTVDGKATDNIAVKGLGSAAYTNTNAYATAAQGTLATNAVRKVATGSGNGTISVTTGTGAATDVAVKGLGSAAYTASNAYATAAQGTKADNAMPKSGGTFTGAVTLNADPTANLQPATKQYVDSKISSSIAASDAMVFKGTIGTNGTSTALPTSAIVGDTYKIITQITVPANSSYTAADVTAKIGDLVVAMAKDPKWLVVPSGDEAVTTVSYSTTTTNLTTSAKTGSITLGEAATKQIDSTIASGSTSTKLPTSKAVADYVTWGNVQGKPSTFTPSSHTHTKDQVGLGNVDNTADANKSVKYAGSAGTATNISTQGATSVNEGRHIWFSASTETQRAHSDSLKYNPSTNTISSNISGIAAAANSVEWNNVKNKPSTYTPSAHTHTTGQITDLQAKLDGKSNTGHTHDDRYYTESEMDTKLAGKANSDHGHSSITTYDVNTIKNINDDTATNWASKSNSIHFYDTTGLLNGQPSQYGFLFNMAYGNSEIHQIWAQAATGSLHHRGGNSTSLEKTWRTILDSSNYTTYTVTKTGSGASGTWGISVSGNAATATKLATSRKIGNASFDGSADITLAAIGAASSGHTHTKADIGLGNVDNTADANKSVKSAATLITTRKIDGVNFNGSADITHYGTCSTEAATAAKVVSLSGFNLVTGARIMVKFTVTNTAASPTLNVNNTGAKAIKYRGGAISAGYLAANRVYEFVYDGTDYLLVGDLDTNSDYRVTNTLATTTKAYITGTTSATTNTGTQVFDTGVYLDTTAGKLVATTFAGNLAGNATTATTANTAKACTGNSATATKLSTTRAFSITGGVTASAVNFDGSGNVSLNATVTSVSTDAIINGVNTLILNCGGAE